MHKSVLATEAIEALHVKSQSHYIDGTVGAGGHTKEILERGGIVLGIEADPKMVEIAKENLKGFDNFKIINKNFRDIDKIVKENSFTKVKGILFDLGISSFHLDDDQRGFSFKDKDKPLDMRLNTITQSVTAAMLLNALPERQLLKLFLEVLKYPEAKKLSKKVVTRRKEGKIETVGDFLSLIEGGDYAKPFMALRIAVNDEYGGLIEALSKALEILVSRGILAVITFHSGEDKIVKEFFKEKKLAKLGWLINKKPIVPGNEEIDNNPRARSAKLRVLEKI